MHPSLRRYVLRPLLLVAAVALATLWLGGRQPVKFEYVIAGLIPGCLVAVLVLRRRPVDTAEVERRARAEAEERIGEYVRINAELTHELRQSRHIEEAQQLQVKAFDAFLQGVTITDPNTRGNPVVYANEGFSRLTGYSRDDVIGKNCRFLQGKDTSRDAVQAIRDALQDARPCFVEILNYRKDGTPFWNALSIAPILDGGRVTHFVGVQTDITAFKQMETQLRQAQKMEAIGHLAGGVAHDFNNLLTVINGCCELLRSTPGLPDDAAPLVGEVHKAGERAATLTRQLLAFSRKTVLQPQVLSLNELVADFEKMLGRLIGEDIALTTALRADPAFTRVDPGQTEQVLMNLVVNARDAMPTGGTLTIGTHDVFLDEDYSRNLPDDVRSGRYVALTVTDTGCGMDAKTRARIFEPFFTTKPVGKGTGLGLAMVYGLVKASGGHVEVESEVGKGTMFRLYFPAVNEAAQSAASASRSGLPGGNETILLVEDETGVRTLARQALESRGYRVLEAANGEEALNLCRVHSGAIDLLVSDVVMPRMSGRELRQQISVLYPSTRVIFTSGYTDDAVVRHGISQADSDFLQKPFTITRLLRKVREVLDRAPANALCGSRV
ncbi:MAG TPA: PAS domain-containing protein [Gemmataceae bacterium]|nr:PAS domain-containing protein [Gemmataceae bacterium]